MHDLQHVAHLADATLHSELKRIAGHANTLTAQLLAHLAELEARGIHRERACSSLYIYCVYELRMSEDEAQRRCRAARLVRQFPALLAMLQDASIHLTGILLLGPHLTQENQAELLPRARYRTKRELERLIAEISPCPVARARVELDTDSFPAALSFEAAPLIVAKPPRATHAAFARALAGPVRQMQTGLAANDAPPPAPELLEPPVEADPDLPRTTAAPLPAQRTAVVPDQHQLRYRVQFTADQAYLELLERARDLLQHELPSRDLVEVQRRALELLVDKLLKRKCAATERPRAQKHNAPRAERPHPHEPAPPRAERPRNSRYVPAAVRRAVWKRDTARCTYTDERGQRCRETAGLQFHHQHPHARGGPANEANIALRCRPHNALAAEYDFGRERVLRHSQERRTSRSSPTPPDDSGPPAPARR
jgi:5-methylcytosine-specific restriction endonuclease McrA